MKIWITNFSGLPEKCCSKRVSIDWTSVGMISVNRREEFLVVPDNDAIIGCLRSVPEVEHVLIEAEGSTIAVFTVIDDDRDDRVYSSIYSRERQLIRQFDSFRFDFNVIARRGRPLEELFGPALSASVSQVSPVAAV